MATKIGCRRTTPKKPLKKKRSTIIAKLDKVFSGIVITRAGHQCEYCGEPKKVLACHHGVVHRRYRNTRFELDNCACVCVACHWMLGDFPKINTEFFKKRIGSDRMEQLQILARSGKKLDLEAIEKDLREKMGLLEEK